MLSVTTKNVVGSDVDVDSIRVGLSERHEKLSPSSPATTFEKSGDSIRELSEKLSPATK